MPVDYQSRRIVKSFLLDSKDGYYTVCVCGPVDPASFPYHSNERIRDGYDGDKWVEAGNLKTVVNVIFECDPSNFSGSLYQFPDAFYECVVDIPFLTDARKWLGFGPKEKI